VTAPLGHGLVGPEASRAGAVQEVQGPPRPRATPDRREYGAGLTPARTRRADGVRVLVERGRASILIPSESNLIPCWVAC
jgi:hypothetical protein